MFFFIIYSSMIKMQKRINYGLEVLQYYTTKEWYFVNDNFAALKDQISSQDNNVFYTDLRVSIYTLYDTRYAEIALGTYWRTQDPFLRLFFNNNRLLIRFQHICIKFLSCKCDEVRRMVVVSLLPIDGVNTYITKRKLNQ